MEGDIGRDEYVMADFGYIWVGSVRNNTGIPWTFGQVNHPMPSLTIFRHFATEGVVEHAKRRSYYSLVESIALHHQEAKITGK